MTIAKTVTTVPNIRLATLADQSRLERFYSLAYPGKSQWKFPERWHWEYAANPFWSPPSGSPDVLPLWVAEDDHRIVGQVGAMCVPCRVGDESVRVALGVDFFVLSSHRGGGLGRKLQESNESGHKVIMAIDMTETTRAIKLKMGHKPFPGMVMFARVNRVEPCDLLEVLEQGISRRTSENLARSLRPALHWGQIDRAAAFWTRRRLLRSSPGRRRSFPAASSLHFEEIPGRFDARADELWQRARQRADFAVERSSDYLNWKFRDQPWVRYHAAFACQGSQPVGLVMYRMGTPPEPPVGLIAELIAVEDSPELYHAMIEFASGELEKAGAHTVIAGASEAGQKRAFDESGFIQYGQRNPIVGGVSELVTKIAQARTVIFSLGDHDMDQFPYLQMPSPFRLLHRSTQVSAA